jgi:DNA end-binding protein Ku
MAIHPAHETAVSRRRSARRLRRGSPKVRKSDEIFDSISNKPADPAMISIAKKIIEQREGRFDPSQFVDRYE